MSEALAVAPEAGEVNWVRVASLADLEARGRKVVKVGRKQIALFIGPDGPLACNNRCPHEGYPLAEGSLSEGEGGACLLTCNWHNWKFDLASGETLTGGDRLRVYPLKVEDGDIWLDASDPPAEARAAEALAGLRDSFERFEYDRMARELARFQATGAEPLEALIAAFAWTHDRFEFGCGHAQAAAADWLTLRDRLAESDHERLVGLLEPVSHLAWDSLRERSYPYPPQSAPYDAEALVDAIEREDEAAAVALLRGALAEGRGFVHLEGPLARAALAHYQDFGHSAIYVAKTGELLERLGPAAAEPLLLALVRSLVFASREDLIPEFRDYAACLEAFDGRGSRRVTAGDFTGLDARRAMALAAEAGGDIPALYEALLGAAAWNWLHCDLRFQERSDGPVQDNVGWLDFTHAITFANAVRRLAGHHPELWPAGLLQMAAFVGRNARYVDRSISESPWAVAEPLVWLDEKLRGLFDHEETEYIVAAHLVKTLTAVREEILAAPDAPWMPTLAAASRRFLESPLRRKQATRTAKQALAFVALEG